MGAHLWIVVTPIHQVITKIPSFSMRSPPHPPGVQFGIYGQSFFYVRRQSNVSHSFPNLLIVALGQERNGYFERGDAVRIYFDIIRRVSLAVFQTRAMDSRDALLVTKS